MSLEHVPSRLAYPVRDFCNAVGIGHSKFYDLVKAGELHTIKLGSKTLVTADEAARFIRSLEDRAA